MSKLAAPVETAESQQSRQMRNNIKIWIFTAIFLSQYFCWCCILLFFKSYYVIGSTWSTPKSRWRKFFDKWYYIVILCQFLIKSKATVLNATVLRSCLLRYCFGVNMVITKKNISYFFKSWRSWLQFTS